MSIVETISLYLFYRKKKRQLNIDIEVPFWAGVSEKDIGVYVTGIVLSNGEIAKCRLAHIKSSTGSNSFGVGFDIEKVGDREPIRQTSFKQFKKDYHSFFHITSTKGDDLYGVTR